jgi:hypothetical protein
LDGASGAARDTIRVSTSSRWLRGLVVDLRSLALFRIALGICLVTDLLLRIPEIHDFYTDQGVLPRQAIDLLAGSRTAFSLHFLSGGWGIQLLLFAVSILFAVGFTLGYRTRLCAAMTFLLVTSMHARNPYVLHGGDAVMRLLLLWSIFAPLNARFSLDRALNPTAPPLPATHVSPASIALVFQVCGIYWYAAAEKIHPVWLGEQSAVYYALNLEIFARKFGHYLLQYPELMRVMTTGTMLLEGFGPLLAISPFFSTPLRLVMVVSFIGFHAGLGLSMRLALFPVVCAAAWLALIPGAFWDRVEARLRRSPRSALRVPEWLRPPPPALPGVGLNRAALIFLLLAVLSFTDVFSRRSVPGRAISFAMLDQRWRMFAPFPSKEDGWYVVEGIAPSGEMFDVWNGGGTPTWSKPADFGAAFRDSRWTPYLLGLRTDRKRPARPYFGRYLCREWNENHPAAEQIVLVNVIYMVEYTPPPGDSTFQTLPQLVSAQPCVY